MFYNAFIDVLKHFYWPLNQCFKTANPEKTLKKIGSLVVKNNLD